MPPAVQALGAALATACWTRPASARKMETNQTQEARVYSHDGPIGSPAPRRVGNDHVTNK
eukprot:1555619-Pyramimonas_sp.AAC.2